MKPLKDEANLVVKIIHGVGANSKAIHVDDKPSFMDVVCEVVIHKCLKHWGGSTESKEHHCWFE